VLLDPAGST